VAARAADVEVMLFSAVRPARLLTATAAAVVLATGAATGALVATEPTPSHVTAAAPTTRVGAHAVKVSRTRSIAANAPDTAATGSIIRLLGTAVTKPRSKVARPRPVRLAERKRGQWQVILRTKTTRAGAFAFQVAAGSTGRTRVFRAQAASFRGLRSATTPRVRVRVQTAAAPSGGTTAPPDQPGAGVPQDQPPAQPDPPILPTDFDAPEPLPSGLVAAGTATDWSYLFGGGSRWDPCRVIPWAYNPTEQGYAALDDVRRAFAKISGASGLRFRYVGETAHRVLGSLGSGFPTEADIVVGWANDSQWSTLAGGVVGVGGGSGVRVSGRDVAYRMQRGYLTLDNGHALPGGFDQHGWGQVILHEVSHALGLGHAQEQVQIMYGMAHRDNIRFGAGDLTGMRAVGAASGCL
jgi:hypothetical protein